MPELSLTQDKQKGKKTTFPAFFVLETLVMDSTDRRKSAAAGTPKHQKGSGWGNTRPLLQAEGVAGGAVVPQLPSKGHVSGCRDTLNTLWRKEIPLGETNESPLENVIFLSYS